MQTVSGMPPFRGVIHRCDPIDKEPPKSISSIDRLLSGTLMGTTAATAAVSASRDHIACSAAHTNHHTRGGPCSIAYLHVCCCRQAPPLHLTLLASSPPWLPLLRPPLCVPAPSTALTADIRTSWWKAGGSTRRHRRPWRGRPHPSYVTRRGRGPGRGGLSLNLHGTWQGRTGVSRAWPSAPRLGFPPFFSRPFHVWYQFFVSVLRACFGGRGG